MRVTFNRAAAVRYALRHVFHPNPAYANMDTMGGGGDCTGSTICQRRWLGSKLKPNAG
jgi:hypothetical protein